MSNRVYQDWAFTNEVPSKISMLAFRVLCARSDNNGATKTNGYPTTTSTGSFSTLPPAPVILKESGSEPVASSSFNENPTMDTSISVNNLPASTNSSSQYDNNVVALSSTESDTTMNEVNHSHKFNNKFEEVNRASNVPSWIKWQQFESCPTYEYAQNFPFCDWTAT